MKTKQFSTNYVQGDIKFVRIQFSFSYAKTQLLIPKATRSALPRTPCLIMRSLAAPVMLISAIDVPVADMPLFPLLPLFAIPDGIDMTDPSDIVMPESIVADAILLVDVETANAAGALSHSMVTAGLEGVAIGFMRGAEVTLEWLDC
jgi:hypothetical protein